MASGDPVTQKNLGKQVSDFDKDKWQQAVPDMLLKGLRAKFTQNAHCNKFLLNTGVCEIGEANKYDSFYGIGKGLHDADVWDKSQWARNLLGKSLMDIRQELQ